MRDELLELRLRDALRSAAAGLDLTITAAELERRRILRKRQSRTAVLLLAAAMGFGLVGAAGFAGGLFNGLRLPAVLPLPSDRAVGPSAVPSSADHAVKALPDLADLIADHAPDRVVLAQANGPASGSNVPPASTHLHAPLVDLGPLPGPADYEVTTACITDGFVAFDFGPEAGRHPFLGDSVCGDGSISTVVTHASGPVRLVFGVSAQASWRLVVRRVDAPFATAAGEPTVPTPGPREETLIRAAAPALQGTPSPSGAAALVQVGELAQRDAYVFRVSCTDQPFVEYLIGDDTAGSLSVLTQTRIACDGSLREDRIGISEPAGARVYVAAAPGARWQLLVTVPPPPAPPPSPAPEPS